MIYTQELANKKEQAQDVLARLMSNKLKVSVIVDDDKDGVYLPDEGALDLIKDSLQDYIDAIDAELRKEQKEEIETSEEEAQRIKEEANDVRYDFHPRPEESLSKEQKEDLM